MRDDDRHAPVDESDRWDIDGKLWGEERLIRQQETDRLLADGRAVSPMTLEDMRAEKADAGRAEAERFGHLEGAATDWTYGDRWGNAS
jgi:hypothetical protein